MAVASCPQVAVVSAPKWPWISAFIPSAFLASGGRIGHARGMTEKQGTLPFIDAGKTLTDQRRGLGRKRCPDGKMARGNMKPVGAFVRIPKLNTVIENRLEESAAAILNGDSGGVGYMHSVLCQTSLPYRDPGDTVREWERRQGGASLLLEAGKAMDPATGKWHKVGLPYGPKTRLILCYINTQAVLTQKPEILIGESLTDFVRNELKLDPKGRNMRLIKDQVTRLAASHIRMGYTDGTRSYNAQGNIVKNYDLWLGKDERQRVLWPSCVVLNTDYFDSLMAHAVPLEMHALAALSHSAIALDIYAWLAQRLHRVHRGKRCFIPWTAAKDQFGPDYTTVKKFREKFMIALRQVHAVYRSAKIDVHGKGLFLYNSPPPIVKTGTLLKLPSR